MKTIKLDTFDGHIVLLCKNWYPVKNVDIFTGLRRIWAIRCALDLKFANNHLDENIANHMLDIILSSTQYETKHLFEMLHNELVGFKIGRPEELTSIEKIILFYISIITNLQIREDNDILIELPKPQKKIIKRIIRGNGRYEDYELLISKN